MLFELLPWFLKRKLVFERDRYVCQYCGSNKDLSVDHIWPRIKGGEDELSNLITACRDCNSSKHDRTLREWMEGFKSCNVVESDELDESNQDRNITVTINNNFDKSSTSQTLGISPERLREFLETILANPNLGTSYWTGPQGLFSRNEFETFMKKLSDLQIVKWRNHKSHSQGRIFTSGGLEILAEMAQRLLEDDLQPEEEMTDEPEESVEEVTEDGDDWRKEKADANARLLDEIIQFAVSNGYISASKIQRKFSIGFTRAARMIDIMEEMGIVGKPEKAGREREVINRQQQNQLL